MEALIAVKEGYKETRDKGVEKRRERVPFVVEVKHKGAPLIPMDVNPLSLSINSNLCNAPTISVRANPFSTLWLE